ncbi:MAG: hypothetical protein Fur0046_31200 [Cyanobacteria bacterium J069]
MTTAPEQTPATQNQDAYDDLLTAIEASEGQLSLLIAVCDDPQLRTDLIARYERDLAPQIQSYRLELAKGEPSLRAAIYRAVEGEDYLKQGGRAVLTLTGTEQLSFLSTDGQPSEQDKFFGYLQWTREALRDFRFPVVLWVTYQVLNNLSRRAPDFWSWRKGVFRFASHKTPAVAARELAPFRSAGLELSNLDDDALLPLEDLKALLHKVEQDNPNDPLVGNLYSQLGRIYAQRLERGEALDYSAELNQAVEYFQAAIAHQEKHEQLLDLASSLVWLGYLYESQGRYSEAEPLYGRSLAITEAQLGADHPDTATSLNNLAQLYYSMGRYREAEPLYGRSLAIREAQLGADHPDTAASLNNLAGLYRAMGRYSEAEPLYGRSLAIREAQLGADHPATATSLNNLAQLYYSMGRYSEAEPLYGRSLAIIEAQLGADHPDTATSLNNLAELYRAMGRYSEAEPLYLKALSILFSRLGQDHPNSQAGLKNFVGLLIAAVQAGRAGELSDHPLTQALLAQLQAEHHPG